MLCRNVHSSLGRVRPVISSPLLLLVFFVTLALLFRDGEMTTDD